MTIKFYRIKAPYGFFSNFSYHPILVDGVSWPTVEHYFQAMKFPDEPERREQIRVASTPADAKRIAWEAGGRLRPDWDSYRDEVMLQALRLKFVQHPDLGNALLETGEQDIVEHTGNDSYWGDGGDGTGSNKLGRLLEQVRAELRAPQT
jgi:ribA/ribD-fused uncharacterized protein